MLDRYIERERGGGREEEEEEEREVGEWNKVEGKKKNEGEG